MYLPVLPSSSTHRFPQLIFSPREHETKWYNLPVHIISRRGKPHVPNELLSIDNLHYREIIGRIAEKMMALFSH